ncbi:MAG: Cytochrome o ubiquinol oxidase subunit IV [Candidatus Tokpelaia hoelldobleri]|uniref:Cytochrome bo(3) ubiquinol oxidase subunit 4 n=1 Tax=Candidatus Tokpelaia hoelldobleri TaxID=1902579 RepID=A0A1U9JVD7_9HYPH|nr:MAG: Cytochrome o ubiquinol oxidase subunit IV [Candidatus Tokpelaia hoelldoblerii]
MSMETYETHGPSVGKYMIGFILSVILTLLAFGAVMLGWLDGWSLNLKVAYFAGLAIIQIAVQMIFFLHLGEGPDAKWNITSVWFTVFCVFIIIYGTWWTMQHLNYQVMGSNGRVAVVDQIQQLRSVSAQETNLSEETAAAPADMVSEQEEGLNRQ